MGRQWGEIAHRGQFSLEIVTAKRAFDEGIRLPPGRLFLGLILTAEDENPTAIAFTGLPNIASFVAEMQPTTLFLSTADGEDPEPLQQAIDDLIATGGAVH